MTRISKKYKRRYLTIPERQLIDLIYFLQIVPTIHFPNPAPGNKPICVGHQYSLVAMAPLGERSKSGHWLIPLSMQRVGLDEKGHEACRKKAVSKKNLVQMFRLSNKRKLYRAPEYLKAQGPGRRKLFGDKVMLSKPETHPTPDAVQIIAFPSLLGIRTSSK